LPTRTMQRGLWKDCDILAFWETMTGLDRTGGLNTTQAVGARYSSSKRRRSCTVSCARQLRSPCSKQLGKSHSARTPARSDALLPDGVFSSHHDFHQAAVCRPRK
jgi:hypothetical protein